jgi:hypothetical protein
MQRSNIKMAVSLRDDFHAAQPHHYFEFCFLIFALGSPMGG